MNVDFVTAIKLYFANYANFTGRSTRAEYWWAMLFVYLLFAVISISPWPLISFWIMLALLIPNFAIMTRRFHDIGKSGLWVWFFVIVPNAIGALCMGSVIYKIIKCKIDNCYTDDAMLQILSDSIATISIGGIANLALFIWCIIWLVKPSGPANKYGPNPYDSECPDCRQ